MDKAMLYDQDFLQWTQQQADSLRTGRWAGLDIENLAEEIEALGRSEQKELGSYLQVLMMHLLKCSSQPTRRMASWDQTIANCRDAIADCLEDTPSSQRFVQDPVWLEKHYRRARRDAAKEMPLALDTFPAACPYRLVELLG